MGTTSDEVLLEQRGDREIGSRRRQVEYGEVDLPGRELGVEPGGRRLDEDEAELGIALRREARSAAARASAPSSR